MSPHHSDQMSEMYNAHKIVFCMSISKVLWVSQWQGHLLSCSGQLKTKDGEKLTLKENPRLTDKSWEKKQKMEKKWTLKENPRLTHWAANSGLHLLLFIRDGVKKVHENCLRRQKPYSRERGDDSEDIERCLTHWTMRVSIMNNERCVTHWVMTVRA